MDKEKIENFYRLWNSQLDNFLSGYIYDENKKPNPTRYIFSYYLKLIERFLKNKIDEIEKINLLSGIRGIGKTTVLGQLFYGYKFIRFSQRDFYTNLTIGDYEKIYLDVSRLSLEGISLNDFFKFYEEEENFHFEKLDRKLMIFLDEVHYDKDWGLFLKSIFDRTKAHKNILVIATGSSALRIKLNPDLSRRSISEELYPLKFSEFLILKGITYPIRGLSDNLQNLVLTSGNAKELYNSLKFHLRNINNFFAKIPIHIEDEFLYFGGFPFVLKFKNRKSLVYELVSGVIDKLITKDILDLRKFKSETIARIKDLLYLIASSDATDYQKLCTTLKLDYRSVRGVIETLIQSGVLVEVKAYGEKFVKVRQPTKFLFISPSLRVSILNGIIPSEIKGKILEDYSALIFTKDFSKKKIEGVSIEVLYDSSAKGADFILRADKKKEIIVEIGYGRKNIGIKQIKNTAKKLDNFAYGIVVSEENELRLIDERIIKIPLKFWLMI